MAVQKKKVPRRTAKRSNETEKPVSTRPRRKRTSTIEPKRSGRPTARRKSRVTIKADKTIILALSPGAGNLLRTILAKSRHEDPVLKQIQEELESQLK